MKREQCVDQDTHTSPKAATILTILVRIALPVIGNTSFFAPGDWRGTSEGDTWIS